MLSYVPGAVLGAGNKREQTETTLCPHESHDVGHYATELGVFIYSVDCEVMEDWRR
jgi:hypothetical protein